MPYVPTFARLIFLQIKQAAEPFQKKLESCSGLSGNMRSHNEQLRITVAKINKDVPKIVDDLFPFSDRVEGGYPDLFVWEDHAEFRTVADFIQGGVMIRQIDTILRMIGHIEEVYSPAIIESLVHVLESIKEEAKVIEADMNNKRVCSLHPVELFTDAICNLGMNDIVPEQDSSELRRALLEVQDDLKKPEVTMVVEDRDHSLLRKSCEALLLCIQGARSEKDMPGSLAGLKKATENILATTIVASNKKRPRDENDNLESTTKESSLEKRNNDNNTDNTVRSDTNQQPTISKETVETEQPAKSKETAEATQHRHNSNKKDLDKNYDDEVSFDGFHHSASLSTSSSSSTHVLLRNTMRHSSVGPTQDSQSILSRGQREDYLEDEDENFMWDMNTEDFYNCEGTMVSECRLHHSEYRWVPTSWGWRTTYSSIKNLPLDPRDKPDERKLSLGASFLDIGPDMVVAEVVGGERHMMDKSPAAVFPQYCRGRIYNNTTERIRLSWTRCSPHDWNLRQIRRKLKAKARHLRL